MRIVVWAVVLSTIHVLRSVRFHCHAEKDGPARPLTLCCLRKDQRLPFSPPFPIFGGFHRVSAPIHTH